MRNVVIWLVLLGSAAGCGSRESTASNAPTGPSLPAGVSASSTPTEVAKVAVSLVEAGDQDGFASLIAADRVAADMQAITRGKSDFEEVRRDAVSLASKTIYRTIDALESPRIVNETIDGDKSKCMLEGTLNGSVVQREMFLVQEDGVWKLVPSHR